MAHGQRSPVRVPYWPNSEDVLESEYARIEYRLLEDCKELGDTESMADYNEFPDDATPTPFEDMFQFQLRHGAEEVDEDRASTMRRRYYRQEDDFEAEDECVYSPTSVPGHLQIEAASNHAPPGMVSRPSDYAASDDMPDHHEEYRRELAFELKFRQFRLSVLSKPTAPGGRTGKGFLWVMLAALGVSFLLHWVASTYEP